MVPELNIYNTYFHPAEGPAVVYRGFSWPGFLFGFIWAFVKQFWIVGAVLLVVDVASILSNDLEDPLAKGEALVLMLNFVLRLFVGVKGNEWRRRDLERCGYEHVGWVKAEDSDAALEAFEESRDE